MGLHRNFPAVGQAKSGPRWPLPTARESYPPASAAAVLLLAFVSFVVIPGALAEYDDTNLLVEEAVNHIYQQRFQAAHQNLKRAYELSPRHPGVHFNLGRLFELTGNPQEALKEYQLAAVLDPSMVSARRGIARCTVELKRQRGAEQYRVMDLSTTQQPPTQGRRTTSPEEVPLKSIAIVDQGSGYEVPVRNPVQSPPPAQARLNLPAMPVSPNLPPAGTIRVPPMPAAVTQQIRGSPKSGVADKIESLIDAGKISSALEALQEAEKLAPDSPEIHYLYGKAFSVKGDMFSAIKHLEEAIKVDERLYEAYYLLAQDYSKVNLLDDAIRNYLVYFGVKPQAGVAVEIARTYERMGNPEGAKDFYSKANAMNPGNPNLQSRLNQSEGEVGDSLYLRANHAFTMEDFAGAYALYQQALALPGLREAYRRDAQRKVEAAKLRAQEEEAANRPAQEGFQTTRRVYGTVNLTYPQLSDISFATKFTGPVTIEWRGFVARSFSRYGQDFRIMIKELGEDELDQMRRSRNDFRLNPNFNNQPLFLLAAPQGAFPPFVKDGTMITITGTTQWRYFNVINDLGQTVKLPTLDFVSAHP